MRTVVIVFLALSSCLRVTGQVSLQTGSATFSLPMFDWKDNHSRLNVKVALNYNSGNGLKVTEIASNVGQGWNLLAGGVITRMPVGEPDDQKPRDGAVEDVNKYPPGFLYNSRPITDGCPIALRKYPLFGDKNHVYKQHNSVAADRELDRFAFQFNGRSGIFILDKNTNKGVSLEDTRIKIWFDKREDMDALHRVRTSIYAFYIQDENGLTYKFTRLETTEMMRTSFCDANKVARFTQPEFKGGRVYHEASFPDPSIANPNVINSWYLTEIEDALTNRKITFSYVNRNIDHDAGAGLSFYVEKNYTIISHARSKTSTPVITAIDFPDGHQITFNYGRPRVDLKGDYALASVDVKYYGSYLSKFQLVTSYFIRNRYGTPSGAYQERSARLCLLAVKRFGINVSAEDKPYQFDYYTGSSAADDIVPPPFFHIKDIWGYYNGDNSRAHNGSSVIPLNKSITELSNDELKGLCFLRFDATPPVLNAKSGYAKNGLLKQIIYPTGSTLLYEYEQNRGYIGGQLVNIGGVHVSKTKVVDGGYSNDCNNPIVTNYSYVNAGAGEPSLWGLEAPLTHMVMNSYYGAENRYVYYKFPFKVGCDYRFKHPGILSRDQAISLTSLQQFISTLSEVLDVVSGVITIIDIVNLCIAATPANILAVVIDIIGNLFNVAITCFSRPTQNETTTVFYNSDINASNPLPVQFKRVVVTEGDGSNGKIIHEFTSPDHYAIWEPTNPVLSMKQRYATWAYGLPKVTTVLDASNNKVKETINDYNFLSGKATARATFCYADLSAFTSCKCLVKKNASQSSADWNNPNIYNTEYTAQSNGDILVDNYKFYSGHAELSVTRERTFKLGDANVFEETSTQYTYNCKNLQVEKMVTSTSTGDELVKYLRYSCDFNTGIMTLLNQNNIITLPVSTYSSVSKPTGRNVGMYYLGEQVTEYTRAANGDVKPSRTLEQRFKDPLKWVVGGTQFVPYEGPGVSFPPSKYVETKTFTYDAASNLVGMKDEGGHSITNFYGYNNKYVEASVINADPVLDKPAYTSFEWGSYGGWSLDGGGLTNEIAVTGNYSFELAVTNSLSANINVNKPYRLSCWATAPIIVNGNATLVRSAPTINGFTYYEYSIQAGTPKVTISGNATIDELRLYPQNARMRSFAYHPLLGKIAECDENNRISYYEYDQFGRLTIELDAQRNIVKMHEYNYANKTIDGSGCVVTYYNKAISEEFTKNDCGPGYIGSKVPYLIPANRYSSTISQAYADLQAENELNTLGQGYANTHGSCIKVYSNVAKSQDFTKEGCPIGTVGTTVTYSVPAGKYTSLISQEDADAQAQYEINANGQAYANAPGNATCVTSTEAVWEGPVSEECRSGHRYYLVRDVNPNSSTYNQTQWVDGGEDPSCPTAPIINGTSNVNVTNPNASGTIQGMPNATVTITISIGGPSGSSGSMGATIGGVSYWVSHPGTPTGNPSSRTFTRQLDGNGNLTYSLSLGGSSSGLSGGISVQ